MLNRDYPKSNILCEPQMGKRGLYSSLSTKYIRNYKTYYLDFLQYSDGLNSLEKISHYIKLNIKIVKKLYKLLLNHKLVT